MAELEQADGVSNYSAAPCACSRDVRPVGPVDEPVGRDKTRGPAADVRLDSWAAATEAFCRFDSSPVVRASLGLCSAPSRPSLRFRAAAASFY